MCRERGPFRVELALSLNNILPLSYEPLAHSSRLALFPSSTPPPPPPPPPLQGRGDSVRGHRPRDEGQVPEEPPPREEHRKETGRSACLQEASGVDGTG